MDSVRHRGWTYHPATVMKSAGLARYPGAPRLFRNVTTGVILETHAYDLYGACDDTALIAFVDNLRNKLDLTSAVIHPIDSTYEHM